METRSFPLLFENFADIKSLFSDWFPYFSDLSAFMPRPDSEFLLIRSIRFMLNNMTLIVSMSQGISTIPNKILIKTKIKIKQNPKQSGRNKKVL